MNHGRDNSGKGKRRGARRGNEAVEIMKKHTANLGCLLLAAALAGCVGAPRTKSGADAGAYLDNPAAYIAYRGYGANREAAESSARAQISRYFSMHIHVTTAERAFVSDAASSSEITEETFVESQTELFAVHYTAPVFSKERGAYELVAYIDRAEAWGMYEPKLRQRADEYSAWLEQARTETNPFMRALRSHQALSCAERNSLDAMLQFAAALYPDGAALYEQTRSGLAALPAAAAQYAAQCPVLIESESAVVKDAVAAALGKARFVVTDDAAKAAVRCAVGVTENRQELEAGTFYTPSVRLVFSETLSDGGKPLFSYEANLERTGARNPQVAQQRAYAKVANHIQDSLLSALEAAK